MTDGAEEYAKPVPRGRSLSDLEVNPLPAGHVAA